MITPLLPLGVLGEVLLGSDPWPGGDLDDPTVLLEEAVEAFRRTGGGAGRPEHAYGVDHVLLPRLRQDGRRVGIPPVFQKRENEKVNY